MKNEYGWTGKLLRVDFEKENNKIKKIKITGDFFIYPETALENIEEIILNSKLQEIQKKLENFIDTNKVTIIGFTVKDLVNILQSN